MGVAIAGQITPHRLLSNPNSETTRKFGTRMIVGGIMSVERINRNTHLLPSNWYLDSANAAIALNSSVINVATTVMNTLFQRKRPKSNLPKISV